MNLKKGLIKIKTLKNPNKVNYIYILTPKGISENKTNNKFYEKMREYDQLKSELKKKN